ncbi:glycosyltransferase [Lapillicoccus jejuensis]|uniref:D-inositol 3-phosphate glycosyltransferase n=1 Tax=Lapillicoccus jejuensis TaxID=402171 RepID=A0A542E298_9MICO|nr:glycosyltransferase [Lapillicoccus jejuensis]TQJ09354.1 glycosyltransferase involved in cell wall biosynthesis [Lapillicoccus jejuensis]
MKVALLSDCYLPRLGGIEVQVHDLAGHLRDRGHHVEVFTATPGEHGERHGATSVVDGVTVHHHALRLPADLPVNPLAPLRMRHELRPYDVAHVHMGVVSPFAVDAAFLTTRLGLPTAMTWHCMLDRTTPVVRGLGVVRRWAAGGMAMSAVSDVAAQPLREVVGDAGPVAVLPNGIDVAAWSPAPAPRADGVVRIVTAMRLARRKRPLPFVRLLRRMRDLLDPAVRVEVDILGEGPDRGQVERYLAEHGMTGWVHLPGRVPRAELPARYAAADVYVSPGELESFGIAALEARTVGLPVVGRQGSGIGEFVTDGVNGYLTAGDDDLAAALARLAADPALRARMRRHNLEHPPAQGWSHVVEAAEREYARAIAGARR